MRSYTSKKGHTVEVSEEHLQTAVRIKQELQKASPARRCSWQQLVGMMEREGYDDAENSENYRQLVKAYQKSIGELPSVQKYADHVADGKLESIKEAVGEIAYEKRDAQHVLKELNKLKREVMDFALTAEELGKAFANHDWSVHDVEVEPRESKSGRKMIVCLSDMHIGALVDTKLNTYNYEIALKRLVAYAAEIISSATYNDISELHIVNLGDVIEHSNMRYGQAFHSEFVYNEQIVRAADAIILFVKLLAKEGFKVSYAGIAGNHDRANDKDKTIDGDHAVRPINYAVKQFMENAEVGEMEYVQANDYDHVMLDVNGLDFKFVHGDLDSFKDEGLLGKHANNDSRNYTAIVGGHVHHFRDIEVGFKKRQIVIGSLKGADEYGDKIRKRSVASQGYIIVDADGMIHVTRVELN